MAAWFALQRCVAQYGAVFIPVAATSSMIAKGPNTATIAKVNTLTARSRSTDGPATNSARYRTGPMSADAPGLRGNLRLPDLQPRHHLNRKLALEMRAGQEPEHAHPHSRP
jgi:hypothetical protein